jgi:hypothetical protein
VPGSGDELETLHLTGDAPTHTDDTRRNPTDIDRITGDQHPPSDDEMEHRS